MQLAADDQAQRQHWRNQTIRRWQGFKDLPCIQMQPEGDSPSAVSTGRAVVIMPSFTGMRARVPGEIGREDAPPAGKGGRSPCVPGRLPPGKVVGLARFELTTSCTPCKRSTKLSYSPRRSGPQQKVDMNEVEADCKPWISGKMRSGGKGLPLTRWRDDGIGGNEVA